MGGVSKAINKVFGGQSPVSVPDTPNAEEAYKRAEEEAIRKRAALADKGMGGTILGGQYGDASGVTKKKLLGE